MFCKRSYLLEQGHKNTHAHVNTALPEVRLKLEGCLANTANHSSLRSLIDLLIVGRRSLSAIVPASFSHHYEGMYRFSHQSQKPQALIETNFHTRKHIKTEGAAQAYARHILSKLPQKNELKHKRGGRERHWF